jgi:hypothetical protein
MKSIVFSNIQLLSYSYHYLYWIFQHAMRCEAFVNPAVSSHDRVVNQREWSHVRCAYTVQNDLGNFSETSFTFTLLHLTSPRFHED